MVGHGSAVTTANNVTCPPTLGVTNSGFPMIGSVVRRSEDDLDTAGFAKGERVREHKYSVCVYVYACVCFYLYDIVYVCVCVGGGGDKRKRERKRRFQ